ncbi:MAG TPA: hypothetical protein DEO89_10235 [Lachnospiraceae bacterium]|nr:hypothetical protein [Lachnospiraceae bacterium]
MQKRTLLVIEDNEINKEFLVSSLAEKYHILSAENGQDGLNILKKNAQDISAILLDIQMPVMNGFEFLEYVAQNTGFCKIPVIVTTVLDSERDEKRCLDLGAVDFIVKPYDPTLVQLRVDNAIYLRECNGIISDLEMDTLTGFKTRKAYYNDIESMEQDEEKRKQAVGIVFADVNGLKEINDTLGHEAGDRLIASVAKKISTVFYGANKYRFGGDEFVILSFDESEELFHTKLKELEEMWGEDYSAAVGSVWLEYARDLEKSVAIADKMMYMDKSRYYENRIQEHRRNTSVDTEEALNKIEMVAELLPGGFFVYQADGEERLITFNQELLKLYNCQNEEEFLKLTGNSFKGMVHPEDLDIVECDISNQIKQERDIDRVKYRIICKDGTEKRVLDYGRFVHTERYGNVYYVFMNDITEEDS